MARPFLFLLVLAMSLAGAATSAQSTTMKPTAPEKMTSPAEAKKMHDCEAQAAANNIQMDQRSKYVMDCMTAKK
jgi:Na+-transporting methylmalonyl-CoA/oxaloacetate decarboxylase gamma subunit